MKLDLGREEVHVWLTHVDTLDENGQARSAALMSGPERVRHDRYRFAKDRKLFFIARAMVRTLLSCYSGYPCSAWTFKENRWGRPEIDNPSLRPTLRFNISHTKGLVACILAVDREVGIDVENTSRPIEYLTIAESVFSPSEVGALKRLPGPALIRRFFELWTLKESYIKARGMGLAIPLDGFSFTFEERPELTIDPSLGDDSSTWQLDLWRPTAIHQAALSIRRSGDDLQVREREWDPRIFEIGG